MLAEGWLVTLPITKSQCKQERQEKGRQESGVLWPELNLV